MKIGGTRQNIRILFIFMWAMSIISLIEFNMLTDVKEIKRDLYGDTQEILKNILSEIETIKNSDDNKRIERFRYSLNFHRHRAHDGMPVDNSFRSLMTGKVE